VVIVHDNRFRGLIILKNDDSIMVLTIDKFIIRYI